MRAPLPLFAALALAAACSSPEPGGGDAGLPDAGSGGAGPEDAAAPDAGPEDAGACTLVRPYSSLDTDCNACAEAHCCAEVNGCLNAPACDDGYVNCILACSLEADGGGAGCYDDCATQYPDGKTAYDTAIGCVDQACATECQ